MKNYTIELDPASSYKKHDTPYQRCRNFLAAIIYQALVDAKEHAEEYPDAIRFLNKRNRGFQFYCQMLDLNSEWIAKHLQRLVADETKKTKKKQKTGKSFPEDISKK